MRRCTRIGLEHIQVGRKNEVSAILSDLEKIQNDGAAIRFIIGRYGSGKSFFLNLCRIVALEKKFIVAQADISLERRCIQERIRLGHFILN